MSDWMQGEPVVADEEDVRAKWDGRKGNFRCGFCGHEIAVGELWCFVYTNDLPDAGGNPFACCDCLKAAQAAQTGSIDHRGILRSWWVQKCRQFKNLRESPGMWWFFRHLLHK